MRIHIASLACGIGAAASYALLGWPGFGIFLVGLVVGSFNESTIARISE